MNNTLYEMLSQGFKQGGERAVQNSKNQNEQDLQGKKIQAEQALKQQEAQAALQQMFTKEGLARQTQANNLDTARGIVLAGHKAGTKLSATLGDNGNVAVSEADQNPATKGPAQGAAFLKHVQDAYNPINKQLDASRATLEGLDLHNSTGDKSALINEASLLAGPSGSRAIGQIISHLSGDPTMAGDAQKAINWINNTPNIPTMTESQRDAIRETVHSRIPQLNQQHQQALGSLQQQGPIVAPYTDTPGLISSVAGPAQDKLKDLQQRQADYQKARAASSPNNAVSDPSKGAANPSTIDRLKGMFFQSPSQPDDANAQAGGGAPLDFNAWKAQNGR